METWKSESQPAMQFATSIGCVALGLPLVYLARNFHGYTSNEAAGFYTGILLLVVGIIGCLITGKQTVIIDPVARNIIVEDSNRFGKNNRVILFSNITHVGIGYMGKASNFVRHYYLILRLSNGERYSLFSPGRFYGGSSHESIVEGWKERLENYIWPKNQETKSSNQYQ